MPLQSIYLPKQGELSYKSVKVVEDDKGANNPKGILSKLGGDKLIVVQKAKN